MHLRKKLLLMDTIVPIIVTNSIIVKNIIRKVGMQGLDQGTDQARVASVAHQAHHPLPLHLHIQYLLGIYYHHLGWSCLLENLLLSREITWILDQLEVEVVLGIIQMIILHNDILLEGVILVPDPVEMEDITMVMESGVTKTANGMLLEETSI